jgi:hypothetical protein
VNARHLRRSVQPLSSEQDIAGRETPLTCDVITRLHQTGRCCSQFGCN